MTFHLYWTIALFVVFVGIFAWAWSSRRKQDFAEAANLPLEDDAEFPAVGSNNYKSERG